MVSLPYDWAFELQQLLGALYENVPIVILNVMAAISAFRLYAIILPFSYRYTITKRSSFSSLKDMIWPQNFETVICEIYCKYNEL